MIRQAAFKGLRQDKAATEVVDERPTRAAPSSNKPATAASRPPPKPAGPNAVMGVTLTNANKVLWPEGAQGAAVTKLDLARYYEAVGEWLLPHLRGRPCSLLRAPDGITGQQFFQRHAMAGISDLFTLVQVKDDKAPYVQIDRVETLIAVAQIGALELHPWNCAEGDPEVAGRLVFDLDPGAGGEVQRRHRGRARSAGSPEEGGARILLQDHRRQGIARGHAIDRREGCGALAGRQELRAHHLRADGERLAEEVSRHDGEEGSRRAGYSWTTFAMIGRLPPSPCCPRGRDRGRRSRCRFTGRM